MTKQPLTDEIIENPDNMRLSRIRVSHGKRDMMLPEPAVGDYLRTYKIVVLDESGSESILETGISTMHKPEYLHEHINYLQKCNPTKSFNLDLYQDLSNDT